MRNQMKKTIFVLCMACPILIQAMTYEEKLGHLQSYLRTGSESEFLGVWAIAQLGSTCQEKLDKGVTDKIIEETYFSGVLFCEMMNALFRNETYWLKNLYIIRGRFSALEKSESAHVKEIIKIANDLQLKVPVYSTGYFDRVEPFQPEIRHDFFNKLMKVDLGSSLLLSRFQELCRIQGEKVGLSVEK